MGADNSSQPDAAGRRGEIEREKERERQRTDTEREFKERERKLLNDNFPLP